MCRTRGKIAKGRSRRVLPGWRGSKDGALAKSERPLTVSSKHHFGETQTRRNQFTPLARQTTLELGLVHAYAQPVHSLDRRDPPERSPGHPPGGAVDSPSGWEPRRLQRPLDRSRAMMTWLFLGTAALIGLGTMAALWHVQWIQRSPSSWSARSSTQRSGPCGEAVFAGARRSIRSALCGTDECGEKPFAGINHRSDLNPCRRPERSSAASDAPGRPPSGDARATTP